MLRRFIDIFPSSHLAVLIKGYFGYNGIPLEEKDESEDRDSRVPADQEEDHVMVIIVCLDPVFKPLTSAHWGLL